VSTFDVFKIASKAVSLANYRGEVVCRNRMKSSRDALRFGVTWVIAGSDQLGVGD
jgi:hypothetical protein